MNPSRREGARVVATTRRRRRLLRSAGALLVALLGAPGAARAQPCVAGGETACLLGGRFEVTVSWTTAGTAGAARVMSFDGARAESDQSAFFYFFNNENFEMGVKMVDACSFNDSFWVFVSGLTNQAFTVAIRDGETGAERSYSNPLGTYPQTIGATDGATGFDCTPGAGVGTDTPGAEAIASVLETAPGDPLAALWTRVSSAPAGARERLVNALPATELAAAGMLLTVETGCSGVLLGCSSFLTAASCICGFGLTGAECAEQPELLTLDDKQVFLPHHGVFTLASIAVHPDYQFGFGHDLALIGLGEAAPGAAPPTLAAGSQIASGQAATVVGFGATGGADFSLGLRRSGQGTTAACTQAVDASQVCLELTAPLGAPGTESGLCLGDEGAPLLISEAGAAKLAGIGSGTTGAACLPPAESFFADLAVDRDWIQANAGADLGTSGCGAAPVGSGSATGGANGTLAASEQEQHFTFEVPAGTLALTATLLGDLFGGLDGDLYARSGAPPTISTFDAASEGSGTFETLQVDAPAAGTWHFLVRSFDGAGDFQLVVTALAPSGEPTVCVADADTACHLGGRFQVEVDWTTVSDIGSGQVMSFGGERASSDQSSFWWFFDAANFEMGVKMVDACVPPFDAYWVFVSGLTNQEYDVRITDTHSGFVRHYRNPLGSYPRTIGATGADTGFPCTP